MVRAKFICESKTPSGQGFAITMRAVTNGTSEENNSFFQYTPSGNFSMSTVNEKAADEFVVGEEYYIDFTKAVKGDN